MKLRREIDCRSLPGSLPPVEFDKCDEIMFRMFGVHRETLVDLWPNRPFLGTEKVVVKTEEVLPVKKVIVADEKSEEKCRCVYADESCVELRRAKAESLRRKTKLVNIQIDLATIELAERRKKYLPTDD